MPTPPISTKETEIMFFWCQDWIHIDQFTIKTCRNPYFFLLWEQSTRAIHREKWLSRRLELNQRQDIVSSQQSQSSSRSCMGQIPILSLCHRAEEWEREIQHSLYCVHWLLWFNCNHFKHWTCIFVFARTILVNSANVHPPRTFLTRTEASWYERWDSFWT